MGEFTVYMIYSAAVMTALYLIYKWLMAGENAHGFNRCLLLAVMAFSFLAPAVSDMVDLIIDRWSSAEESGVTVGGLMFTGFTPQERVALLWPGVVIAIYFAGIIVALACTILSYRRLRKILAGGERRDIGEGLVLVVTDDDLISPFSWLRYVVMSRTDYETIGEMVMIHELQHLRKRHWIDMVLAQAVVVVQWFNPAAWLLRAELRTVHEYEADNAVLEAGVGAREYQMMLIKKAVGRRFPALANSLNHSNLKKRITMMLKTKSGKSRRMLAFAMVPAVAAALAVCDMPLMASTMGELRRAEWPEGQTKPAADKISEKNAESEIVAIKMVEKVEARETDEALAVIGEEKAKKDIPAVSSTELWEKDGEKPDRGDVVFVVDGKKMSKEEVNKILPEQIASMTVDKQDNRIDIKLKKGNEKENTTIAVPKFPGSENALLQFVTENLHYPESAQADGKKYRVVVSFTVDEQGKAVDAKILRGQGEAFDAEALRVVSILPNFEPAIVDGKPIATSFVLPMVFQAR